MKQTILWTAGLCLFTGSALFAVENQLDPKSWSKQFSASGQQMEIAPEVKENAMRFLVTYPDAVTDRWVYPLIKLAPGDREANVLSFDIRAVQNPAGRGYKNCLVIFVDEKGKQLGGIEFAPPKEEYTTVTIDLDKRLKFPLADARSIRIGVNTRDAQEVVMFIRNINFTKSAPVQ